MLLISFRFFLVIHISYNKKLETEENFIRHVRKVEKVQKLWRMRNLTVIAFTWKGQTTKLWIFHFKT